MATVNLLSGACIVIAFFAVIQKGEALKCWRNLCVWPTCDAAVLVECPPDRVCWRFSGNVQYSFRNSRGSVNGALTYGCTEPTPGKKADCMDFVSNTTSAGDFEHLTGKAYTCDSEGCNSPSYSGCLNAASTAVSSVFMLLILAVVARIC